MEAINNTTQNSNQSNANVDKAWADGAKKTLMNLGTSDSNVYEFMVSEFTSKDSSPQRQQILMYLMGKRQEMTTLMSNMIRMISDGANNIIRNIRA